MEPEEVGHAVRAPAKDQVVALAAAEWEGRGEHEAAVTAVPDGVSEQQRLPSLLSDEPVARTDGRAARPREREDLTSAPATPRAQLEVDHRGRPVELRLARNLTS